VLRLAKHLGLKTVSVVRREEAAAKLRELGADLVVVDGDDLAGRIKQGLDGAELKLALDGAGDATIGALASAVEFGGTVVSYSSVTGQPPAIGLYDHIYRQVSLRGLWIVNWLNTATKAELDKTYTELAALITSGVLSLEVAATYPLSDYRKAWDHARESGRAGKVLFRP
jgi:NADPH:quinone reductase-like Zn-dependent oxidoreductase